MRDKFAAMIRVDQAGEYGAVRIYAGQMAVMGDRAPHSAEVAAMAAQEADHRKRFDALLAQRGVRPTALQPVWSVAGFALGAATALIGPEAAMACTAAIETEIDRHYTEQLDELGEEPFEAVNLFEHDSAAFIDLLGSDAAALQKLRGPTHARERVPNFVRQACYESFEPTQLLGSVGAVFKGSLVG